MRRWATILAALFFTYAALRGLDALIRYQHSSGYLFYQAIATPAKHFMIGLPQTLFAAVAAFLLWRRAPAGLAVALLAAVVLAGGTLLETGDVSQNLEVAKEAYAA